MSAVTLSGSCLCGGVKYRVEGDLLTSVNCHCSMCRKAHGAAFRSGAVVKAQNFSWLQGEELVTDYRSSEQMHRMFCRTCGSHSDLPYGPKQHWNVASKAAWFEITDPLPQFAVVPHQG